MREDTTDTARPIVGLQPEREGFWQWKAAVDAIADQHNMTPKDNPLPGELDVWVRHFNAGKTP